MTQDAGPTSTPGHSEEQKQPPEIPAVQVPSKPVKPVQQGKDLYEPYDTPPILWGIIRFLARVLFALLFDMHVRGRQNLPKEGPYILASNHLSSWDVPLIPAYVTRKVVAMAKEELFHGKGRWVVRFMGGFPVKRGESDRQALRAADEQLKKGKVLFIFPEGTRSRKHTLAKGHAGMGVIALRSGVPIVPAAVWGSEYALKKFRPRVTIVYGKPIMPKPKGQKVTREDINETTEQVMQAIASMLPPEYRGVYGTGATAEEPRVEGSPETLQ